MTLMEKAKPKSPPVTLKCPTQPTPPKQIPKMPITSPAPPVVPHQQRFSFQSVCQITDDQAAAINGMQAEASDTEAIAPFSSPVRRRK